MIKFLLGIMMIFTFGGCADALIKQTLIITSPFIAKIGKTFYDRNLDDTDEIAEEDEN